MSQERRGSFWVRWFGGRGGRDEDEGLFVDESDLAFRQGRYGDAEKLLTAAVREAESDGEDSPRLADALANLAEILRAQARYTEAEPLYRRSIAVAEACLGPRDPSLTRPLNGLALVYRAQGLYEAAEPLCRRGLEIADESDGGGDTATLSLLTNLVAIYLAQGRYADAEPLYRRMVALKEKVLGPEHPDFAGSLGNYAALVRKTKGAEAAAPLEARAASIRAGRSRVRRHSPAGAANLH